MDIVIVVKHYQTFLLQRNIHLYEAIVSSAKALTYAEMIKKSLTSLN